MSGHDPHETANLLRRTAERVSDKRLRDRATLLELPDDEAHRSEVQREAIALLCKRLDVSHNGARPEQAKLSTVAESLASARVDLIELIREGVPEREFVSGGEPWLMRGKRYLAVAGAGTGKTLGAQVVAVE